MSQVAPLTAPRNKDHVRVKATVERSESDKKAFLLQKLPDGWLLAFCMPKVLFAAIILAILTWHPVVAPYAAPILAFLLRAIGIPA